MNYLKPLFTFWLLTIGLAAMSQSDSDYAALADFMSVEELLELENSAPLQYQRLAYVNRHAYYISNMGEKGSSGFPSAFEIEKKSENAPEITLDLIQSNELNLLAYQFEYSHDKYHYYKLDDNGAVLAIIPLALVYKKANLDSE